MTILDSRGRLDAPTADEGEAIARELADLLNRAETAGVEVWPVVDREGVEHGVTWECTGQRAGMLVAWNPDGWSASPFSQVGENWADA